MNLGEWRRPSDEEQSLIEGVKARLAEIPVILYPFPTLVRSLHAPDYRLIEFKEGSEREIPEEVVLELVCPDTDGVAIELVFAVRGCRPWSLEFIKADASPINRLPDVREFRVFIQSEWT